MNKIIRMNGFVYLVENWDRKGFETYYNLGKDENDPMWKDEVKEMKFNKKKNKKEKETE